MTAAVADLRAVVFAPVSWLRWPAVVVWIFCFRDCAFAFVLYAASVLIVFLSFFGAGMGIGFVHGVTECFFLLVQL